jgi:hypothetical protein
MGKRSRKNKYSRSSDSVGATQESGPLRELVVPVIVASCYSRWNPLAAGLPLSYARYLGGVDETLAPTIASGAAIRPVFLDENYWWWCEAEGRTVTDDQARRDFAEVSYHNCDLPVWYGPISQLLDVFYRDDGVLSERAVMDAADVIVNMIEGNTGSVEAWVQLDGCGTIYAELVCDQVTDPCQVIDDVFYAARLVARALETNGWVLTCDIDPSGAHTLRAWRLEDNCAAEVPPADLATTSSVLHQIVVEHGVDLAATAITV